MVNIINNTGWHHPLANVRNTFVYIAGAGLLALKISAKATTATFNWAHGKFHPISLKNIKADADNWYTCIKRSGSAAKRIFSGAPNPRSFSENCLFVREAIITKFYVKRVARRLLLFVIGLALIALVLTQNRHFIPKRQIEQIASTASTV